MSFTVSRNHVFRAGAHKLVEHANDARQPMGFNTHGGKVIDGPPPESMPLHELCRTIDNGNHDNGPGGGGDGGNGGGEPTGMGRDNYQCDVFQYVSETVNKQQDDFIDPGLTVCDANIPGQVIIHDVDRASELNRQHREEHLRNDKDRDWYPPHEEQRLVVDYIPNSPATFDREYNDPHMMGDPAHAQVFTTTPGSLSMDTVANTLTELQRATQADHIVSVTSPPRITITRSIVARSTTGRIQYMVYRDTATFEPK